MTASSLQQAQACMKWCREKGAHGNVGLICREGTRGLTAPQELKAGENVLTIPKSVLIHLGTAEGSDLVSLSPLGPVCCR